MFSPLNTNLLSIRDLNGICPLLFRQIGLKVVSYEQTALPLTQFIRLTTSYDQARQNALGWSQSMCVTEFSHWCTSSGMNTQCGCLCKDWHLWLSVQVFLMGFIVSAECFNKGNITFLTELCYLAFYKKCLQGLC